MEHIVEHSLLLSIQPQFAERIYAGTKKFEIRKVAPIEGAGNVALIYESGTERKITGWVAFGSVDWYTPDDLWNSLGRETGLKRAEFEAYCGDRDRVAALSVASTGRFDSPLTLEDLRDSLPEFMPPQNFRYIRSLPEHLFALLSSLISRLQLQLPFQNQPHPTS